MLTTPTDVDCRHLQARSILLPHHDTLHVILVGTGGTGSYVAPALARLAVIAQAHWNQIRLTWCDPDWVEPKNIPRQNFSHAEIGQHKAETLARRYSAAWGLPITAITTRYSAALHQELVKWNETILLIDCVDNPGTRVMFQQILTTNEGASAPRCWWLHSGNWRSNGQILVGSAVRPAGLTHACDLAPHCTSVPSPGLQHPELLREVAEHRLAREGSCADMAIADAQSLTVNQYAAAVVADYALRLMITGDLRRFATYFDLDSGTTRSRYTTPEELHPSRWRPPHR